MKKMLPAFVWTEGACKAVDAVECVRVTGEVLLIVGPPGSGKSAFVQAAYGDGPFVSVEAHVPSTPRSVTRSIFEALGRLPHRTALEDCRSLVRLLPDLGVQAIVVDDVQRMSGPAYDVLRHLQDRTGLALVLCGTMRAERLLGQRCPELAHRVARVHVFEAIGEKDLRALIRSSSAFQGRRDVSSLSQALMEASDGNLRRVEQTLVEARRRARARHCRIDVPLVRRVADDARDLVLLSRPAS